MATHRTSRPEPTYAPVVSRRSHSRSGGTSREYTNEKPRRGAPPPGRRHKHTRNESDLPQYNHNGHRVTSGIHPDGESGRRGIHPIQFVKICFKSTSTLSMWTNLLWPIVPIAIALHFVRPQWHVAIFATNYIAMIPAANMLGFAGQEFSRKLHQKALAVVVETTFGSIVELILFMVLLKTGHGDHNVHVIRAAILGSILANLLLCLGTCFVAGGVKHDSQEFHDAVSESASGLILIASIGLVLPAVFNKYLSYNQDYAVDTYFVDHNTRKISRGVAIISLVGYLIYLCYQTMTHDGLFHEIYEADEHKDADRHEELRKPKLTMTEVVVALLISLTCVSLVAIFLVMEIPSIVEHGVSDAFVGLILVPLVEKFAEHLLAIDEAYDNQINMALAHIMGASIQTALLNAPLTVLVGWGIGVHMDYNFVIFDAVALILSVLAVGNFLRDGKSNYLEGVLCIMTYCIIAVCAFFFPDPKALTAAAGHH